MRVGIVGLGYWGSKHVRVMSSLPTVDRVVGIDLREDRRRAMEGAFPGLEGAETMEEALASVDAVVIATSPRSHYPLAAAALRAGKHVLVEKPLTIDSADARDLVRIAEEERVTLMVGHTFEHNAAVHALREIITSGDIGRLLYVNASRVNLGLFQTDCDVIWDLAPHDVSILNLLFGRAPDEVHAWGSDHLNLGMVDNAYVGLRYGEAQAMIHVSWLNPHKERRITVVGSQKMAVYDDLADDHRLRIYDKGVSAAELVDESTAPLSYRYGDIVSPYIPFPEPLMTEDRHFLECARTGATPTSSGAVGLAVVEVLEAASESLVTGRRVSLAQPHARALDSAGMR